MSTATFLEKFNYPFYSFNCKGKTRSAEVYKHLMSMKSSHIKFLHSRMHTMAQKSEIWCRKESGIYSSFKHQGLDFEY